MEHSKSKGTGLVLQAELELQVAPFLALAHAVVGAIALLPDKLQLFAHRAAVQTFITGVPPVCVVVVRTGDTHGLPPGCAVLFQGGARGTFIAHQLTRSFWVIMKVPGRKDFLGGPFNGDVQELEEGRETVACQHGNRVVLLSKSIIKSPLLPEAS